jgi:hypothetical protein
MEGDVDKGSPMTHATASRPLPQPICSAEELFALPSLAYLRAAQGERIALICRGVGGLIRMVEALGGQLVWFFPDDAQSVEELIAGCTEPFDLVIEYRPGRGR